MANNSIKQNNKLKKSKRFGRILLSIITFRWLIVGLVMFYKKVISPAKRSSCRFTPSCSSYMLEAIEKHGVIKGTLMGLKRIARCNPLSKGGFDPVPENPKKGEVKWLF